MSEPKQYTTHVLLTLGVLFTLGGATRFLPSQASAEDVGKSDTATPIKAGATAPRETDALAGEQVCFTGEMAEKIAADQRSLASEKDKLVQERLELQSWQDEINAQLLELESIQEALEARWGKMIENADGDIEHLARMYGSMKPDQAARIFDKMDPAFAAGFLRLMPSDQAGLIMAAMDAEQAYSVSVMLATKNMDIRSSTSPG